MTLVYRAPKHTFPLNNQNPGPADYQSPMQKPKQTSNSCAFASKVARDQYHQSSETNVGPGSYTKQNDDNRSKKQAAIQPVFKSKIQRFQTASPQRQKMREPELASEFNELMKKQREEKQKIGRLIGLKERREIQQKYSEQHLPSIPTVDNSFGYKYDHKSKKLVGNQNPKIIFAQNLKISQKSEDYFFQRSHGSLIKSNKITLGNNAQRSPSELIHQLKHPSSLKYHSDNYDTIQEQVKKSGNINAFASKLARFGEQSPSKKEMLKLCKLKKQFGRYLNQQINLQQLQSKQVSTSKQKSPASIKKTEGKQCFMTKENRFKAMQKASSQAKDKSQNITKTASNSQKKIVPKQPYSLGEERFQQNKKQNLGPGSYIIKEESSSHHSGFQLNSSEPRFKSGDKNFNTPGPGAYQPRAGIQVKEKLQVNFNHFRSKQFFKSLNPVQQNFSSMENLYQQVGVHMNYLCKVEKESARKKLNTKQNYRKLTNPDLTCHLQKMKGVIRQKINYKIDSLQTQQNTKLQNIKNIRYDHLYGYNKPEQKINVIGPGYYELRTTLEKKSFNKSEFP